MLAAGRLRWRIAIEHQVTVQDPDTLELTTSWEIFADQVPAEIMALSAREWLAAGARQTEVDNRITIRFLTGVTASMRARDIDTGAIYAIQGVIPDKETGRESMTLPAKLGPTDGS
jgi:SPP1 family predicted phage head-tail adaptor